MGAGTPTAIVVGLTIGAVFCAACYAVRPLRRPLYGAWMSLVYPIGWVISHVILIAIYFFVFTPTAWILRLAGSDPMQRQMDRGAISYWVRHHQPYEPLRYFKQF